MTGRLPLVRGDNGLPEQLQPGDTLLGAGSGSGTVTNVATGTGLTGGPITSTGTVALANTAVSPNTYGDSAHVSQITVDQQGRITTASSVAISAGSGTVTNVATGTGLTGGPITSTGTVALANTAVSPNTYGDSAHVSQFTVDQQGRITSASSVAISAGSGTVTNVATGTGLTGGPITSTGTVALANTAVSPNTYGDSAHVSQITVDQQGRITAASSVAITGGSGVSSVSNSDGTLTISPTTGAVVASARVATSSVTGIVKPDNSTITISAGVISATGGGGGSSGGVIDLAAAFGLVADDSTDNATAFSNMTLGLKAFVGASGLTVSYGPIFTVTLSAGTPGTVNLAAHNQQAGAAVAFFGNLAGTGLTAGTVYYVAWDTLLNNSFRITAVDPLSVFYLGGTYPSLNITGAGSGVTMREVNKKVVCRLNPGTYKSSQDVKFAGPPELDIYAYGAVIDGGFQLTAGAGVAFGGGGFFPEVGHLLNTVLPGASSVVLKNAGDAVFYPPGSYFCIAALNGQDLFGTAQSGPDSAHVFEYQQVRGISGATILLGNPTGVVGQAKNGYLDTYPDLRPAGVLAPMGPVRAYPCSAQWARKTRLFGLRVLSPFQCLASGLFWEIKDCSYDGQGPVPTQTAMGTIDNVRILTGPMVVDKLVSTLKFTNIQGPGIQIEGAGPDVCEVDNGQIESVAGTSRLMSITNSVVHNVDVGALLAGPTEALYLNNARINQLNRANRGDDSPTSGALNNATKNWVYNASGIIEQQMIHMSTAMTWAVPGRKMYLSDLAQLFPNMGSPFEVLNVRQTADATITTASVGTSSRVVTTGTNIANDTVVSFDINSPLPSGGQLLGATPYWVVNTNGTTAFDVAATKGGSAIIPTGTGTTNVTVYKNPKFAVKTTLRSIPAGPTSSAAFTATHASPCVFTTGTNVPNGTPVIFPFSDGDAGTLPGGFDANHLYYVVNSNGSTTFQLSTDQVTPLNSTTTGTGTAIGNPLKFTPHPCPRVTAINCTGCQSVLDACNAPKQGRPLYTFGSRTLIGDLSATPTLNPGAITLWGNLKSLTVNVVAADSVSTNPTLTIFAKGFNSSLGVSNLSSVIDLGTIGIRTVTPTSNSGTSISVKDVLANYGDWLCGTIVQISYQNILGGQQSTNYATVYLEMETDQGIFTNSSVILYHDQEWANPGDIIDTGTPGIGADPGV
jgi:hypothetical protein